MSGLHGIKDLSDIILLDKATGLPALAITYANTASLDVTSEPVFAQVRGANKIRWDSDKNATLTIEAEAFEMGYLALMVGSEVAEGRSDIFKRLEGVVNGTRAVRIGDGADIRPETISVIRLSKPGSVEHVGLPLHNASSALLNLPAQVRDVTVSANDTTAKINFRNTSGANKYVIMRNNSIVAETEGTDYTDTGLTADETYKYKIYAVNQFGTGAVSAEVDVLMSASGTIDYTQYVATSQALAEAAGNAGTVATPSTGVAYTFENGVIRFNEQAQVGDAYAIYFMEATDNVKTFHIDADKFAGSYEIFANAFARFSETDEDDLLQFNFFNAKPQANMSLAISGDAPTTLSITFDLMVVSRNGRNALADIKLVR